MLNRMKKIGFKQPNNNQDEGFSQKFSMIISVVMFILGFILTK